MELLHLQHIIVAIMYCIFAIQLQYAKNKENKKVITVLQIVFILCGLCGHILDILGVQSYIQNLFYTVLVVFSVWLVTSNQATAIGKALTKD